MLAHCNRKNYFQLAHIYEIMTKLTMTVLELPPNESCSKRVNLEFLYGMCVLLPSTNALITLPNTDRDKLIFVASLSRMPVVCVLLCRSDPCGEKFAIV